jgi:hypothetical protein
MENFWRWCEMKYQNVPLPEDCRRDYTPPHFSSFSTYLPPYDPERESPPPPSPSWTERFGDWISEKLDNWEQSKHDAENRRLRKIYVECRASSVTEAQTAACIALKTGKY